MVGGPATLARNFAVMTGVNAGLQCAIKKARGGVEDVKGRRVTRGAARALAPIAAACRADAAVACSMAASFGAGAAFSVVSTIGAPVRAPADRSSRVGKGGCADLRACPVRRSGPAWLPDLGAF